MRRALIVLLVAALVAGCGGGGFKDELSKSADAIAADAQKAARSAEAVHVFGTIVQRGQPLLLDLHLVRNVGAVGRMGLGGGTVRLVRVGSKVFMNGDTAFWSAYAGPTAAPIYANKWLRIPTSSKQIAPFVRLTDIDQLFGGAIGAHGKIDKDGTKTYRNKAVIVLKEAGSSGWSLYIAANGTPYPAAIVSPNGGKEGAIVFDQWNRRVAISAPKGAGALPGS